MLDLFTIFGKGGLVLWCFQGTQQLLDTSVNALVRNVLLQERSDKSVYKHGDITLKYKLDNEFSLVFVAVYQSIVQLTYVDKLLTDVNLKFRDMYKQELGDRQLLYSLSGSDAFAGFDAYFNKIMKVAQASIKNEPQKAMRTYDQSDKSAKYMSSIVENKSTLAQKEVKKNKEKAKEKNQKVEVTKPTSANGDVSPAKAVVTTPPSPGHNDDQDDEVARKRAEFFRKQQGGGKPAKPKEKPDASPGGKGGKKGKAARVWEPRLGGGNLADADQFDFSDDKPKSTAHNGHPLSNGEAAEQQTDVNRQYVGTMKGQLAGLDDEQPSDDDDELDIDAPHNTAAGTGWLSAFTSLVGNKTLTRDDIQPVLDKMKDSLIEKNVAAEIAAKLCDSVGGKIEGKVLGTFERINTTVKEAMRESLTQILAPKRRVDILRDVLEAKQQRRPYVIVFCGVNGVGKSTNLAKITFWLTENGHKVLIAAGDTFRAGAVEQLRTHMRHLNALHPESVQLYEQGYGKDPANIAMHAISFAVERKIDVVLVDTAGRMQDNEPLMRALSKLIKVNEPDLCLFVGEALVGNEAVDQLVKFNQALADHATPGAQARLIDGIVLTKFDTIDDKVGAAISMTYITGQPIVFVGTGQTYADLKNLNVESVVKSLLK